MFRCHCLLVWQIVLAFVASNNIMLPFLMSCSLTKDDMKRLLDDAEYLDEKLGVLPVRRNFGFLAELSLG